LGRGGFSLWGRSPGKANGEGEDISVMDSKDLGPIVEGWPYEPGQINVRKIRGSDRRVRLQMRVDLGVLQMELIDRPDGVRPYECDSLLDHHQAQIASHEQRNGTKLGFSLTPDESRAVREETLQYYQRYLAYFALEDYEAVIHDTQHNLDLLDLCFRYADEDSDRYALEAYRPYILMMNIRSKALEAMKQDAYLTALAHVERGLEAIKAFFEKFGNPEAFDESGEVAVLKALQQEIRRYIPVDPIHELKQRLSRAVTEERYEDAAELRDQLDSLLRGHGD